MTGISMRTEHDLLGERSISDDAYYGIHSLRATENGCVAKNHGENQQTWLAPSCSV
jgi:aspartate ammonia-lyase